MLNRLQMLEKQVENVVAQSAIDISALSQKVNALNQSLRSFAGNFTNSMNLLLWTLKFFSFYQKLLCLQATVLCNVLFLMTQSIQIVLQKLRWGYFLTSSFFITIHIL